MKMIVKVVVGLLITAGVAWAACPPYAPYNCRMFPNGKVICGCGV